MADQKKIRRDSPNGFAHLTHDVISLCEMQGRLFVLDVQASMARTRNAAVVVATGAVLIVAALLIGLAALAELLIEQFGLPRSAGYAISALAALIVGGIVVQVARVRFRQAAGTLNRSYDELTKNLHWIKSRLQHVGPDNLPKDISPAEATHENPNGHTRRFTT